MSKEDMERVYAAHGAYSDAMTKAGVMRGGAELKPVSTATSVRFENGRAKTVDGPFAETKEMVAGFYLIEARDLHEATEVASRIPSARLGTVEVRPTRQLIVEGP